MWKRGFILWKKGKVFSEDFLGFHKADLICVQRYCGYHHVYHSCIYPYFKSAGIVRSICDHRWYGHGGKGIKWCIYWYLYRCVYRNVSMCCLCEGSVSTGAGNGLNAFFAYTVMLGMGYTYNQTLTIVFLSGAWKYQRCGLFWNNRCCGIFLYDRIYAIYLFNRQWYGNGTDHILPFKSFHQ